MTKNFALLCVIVVSLTLLGACCGTATPEPEEGAVPDVPDATVAEWEGSGPGGPPVVIYPEKDLELGGPKAPARPSAPASASRSAGVSGSSGMNRFLEENRQLRRQVEGLMRELDGVKTGPAAAALAEGPPAVVAPEAPVPAVPAAAPISVESVRTVLASAGAGEFQTTSNARREVYLTLPGTISFASGKAELSSSAKALVLRALSALKAEFPGLRVRVEGHTDSTPIRKSGWGTNKALSEARAKAVADHIVRSTPVSPAEVETIGYGEVRPVATNASALGRKQNRRCEIVLLP